jgi:hypothetical protein
VAAFPELGEVASAPADNVQEPAPPASSEEGIGAPYRRAHVRNLPDEREPFTVDPAAIERGVSGHVESQNTVADALRAAGIEPRSPRPVEPNFDLAWERAGTIFVAEVKSITARSEERQLRLGLGQVLRYRALLEREYEVVRAVLIPERAPSDPSWRELCTELGILLVTPVDVSPLLR